MEFKKKVLDNGLTIIGEVNEAALTAAVGVGALRGPDDIRHVMRNSFELACYEPQDRELWADKLGQYSQLKQASNRR
jgi:hypothetical protein